MLCAGLSDKPAGLIDGGVRVTREMKAPDGHQEIEFDETKPTRNIDVLWQQYFRFDKGNLSITVGRADRARGLRARRNAEVLELDHLGVHRTAPPSASAVGAAAAFLAAISSPFWRINSAKRGI